jgi:hypothetical protein
VTPWVPRSTVECGAAALALLGLVLWILKDTVFFGGSFYERDLLAVYYPAAEAAVRTISEGSLPLRDPTTGFGQPILGHPDLAILYPPTWVHLFLLPDRAYTFIVFIHFLLGAFGAAVLAFRLSPSPLSAFFAGAFWLVSGPFQSMLTLWHHFEGAAWMPWVLAAFDRLLEMPDRKRTLLLAVTFGLQMLAGSADMCAMTVGLVLLLLICHALQNPPVSAWMPFRASLAALGVALCLGTSTWLTAGEILGSSSRSSLPHEVRTFWSIHPLVLAEFGVPLGLGNLQLSPATRDILFGGREPFVESVFLGPLLLPFFLGGLLTAFVPKKYRLFIGLGVLMATLASLGGHTPVYDFMVAALPPLKVFRYPSKLTVPISLLIAVLAGICASRLDGKPARRAVIAGAFFSMAVHAVLYMRVPDLVSQFISPSAASRAVLQLEKSLLISLASLAVVAIAMLGRHERVLHLAALSGVMATVVLHAGVNPAVASPVLRYRPEHVAAVLTAEPSRLYVYNYVDFPLRSQRHLGKSSPFIGLRPNDLSAAVAYVVGVRGSLTPSVGGAWGIEYAWDIDLRGTFDRTLRDLTVSIGASTSENSPELLRLLQIANVSHVAALHREGFQPLSLKQVIETPLADPLFLFEVPAPLPRAYAVRGIRVLDTQAAARSIFDPAFNPGTEVILDQGAASSPSASFVSRVTMASRRSDRIVLDVTQSDPGAVVLLEGWLPGWHATVDGVRVPIRRANALFLAVETAAGVHRVVFSYRPWTAVAGTAITALTAIFVSIGLARYRERTS